MHIKIYILIVAMALTGCQTVNQSIVQNKNNTSKYQEFVQSGDQLPIDSIETIDGSVIDFNGAGKRKLVILFATWCSDSNRLLNALNSSKFLSDKNIEIVAIAREEGVDTVAKWREENKINVPLAVDPDRSIYKLFAEAGIPRIITVSTHGEIIQMNLAEGEEQLSKIYWGNNKV